MVSIHDWEAWNKQRGRIRGNKVVNEAELSRLFPCPVDTCTFAPNRAEDLFEHIRKHHPHICNGEIIAYRIDVVYGVNKKVGHPDFFPWRKLLPNGQIVKLLRDGQIVNRLPRKRKVAVEEPSSDSTSGTTESGTTEAGTTEAGTVDAGSPESGTSGLDTEKEVVSALCMYLKSRCIRA